MYIGLLGNRMDGLCLSVYWFMGRAYAISSGLVQY